MLRCSSFLLIFASVLEAAQPVVEKVEPPSWWAQHSIRPVRLLVKGQNLKGARVESTDRALKTGVPSINDSGTYLFVDVTIDRSAKPGRRELRVRTPDGDAALPLEVLEPLPRQGRFQGFSPDDVIYLVMPDRFANGDPDNDDPAISRGLLDRSKPRYYHGGDFRGILARLPYLKSLGVTALWLNPWYDNVNHLNQREKYDNQPITDYHGYGAVDFYGVEEHFGNLETLRELVEAAHKSGIKVIQDQVANHSGPYHPWVQDAPTPTWFNGTEKQHLANTWQTWTLMDPHATPQMRKATLEGWFIDILPDLNQGDPEVSRYIIQNTLWWAGVTGLDAIRQDTAPYVPRAFWRDWMAAIKKEYPHMNVVGEVFDGDPAFTSFFQTGRAQFDGVDSGLDTVFDFPLFYAIRRAFGEGGPPREIGQVFAHDRLYPNPGSLVTFLGLHDVDRFMNTRNASIAGLKMAFTLLMTARGIPMIYYGDEIALPGGGDPDNRRDFPGGWPGDPRNAFEASGRSPDQQSLWEHVARLTALRASTPVLRRGDMRMLRADDSVLAYARVSADQSAVVVFNNAATQGSIDIAVQAAGLADGIELRDMGGGQVTVTGGTIRITLPGRSSTVLVRGR